MHTYLLPILPLILCSACASAPGLDPTNPYELNEKAAHEVQAGRLGTAEILLERAMLTAPHDATIKRNRDAVRAYRAGRSPTMGEIPSIMTGEPKGQGNTASEPSFPLWPIKRIVDLPNQ